jgi:RHS repeat-associated protein
VQYGAANQLIQVQQTPTVFDEDGNLLQAVLDGETVDFRFNSCNLLMQVGDVSYQYDAENQRIAVNDTEYVINSQPNLSQALVRTKGNGEVTYYVYGLGLIGEESAGNYFSYHFDYRGSTIAITNITGQLIDSVQYSPFGIILSQPIFDTPFLFNGLYGVMTDGNRLNYMRARYYSPEIRRFVNQDVLLGNIADGQSLNRYAYVTGNPISFIDPFGLEPWDWDGQGDTSICYYYDEMAKQNSKCSYYSRAAGICRGKDLIVNGAMVVALGSAWGLGDLTDSQSTILENIRTILVWEDIARREEGRVNPDNDCVWGNDIDAYHDLAFDFAGLWICFMEEIYGLKMFGQILYLLIHIIYVQMNT